MDQQVRVLIVDDEPEILRTLRRRLRLEDIPADVAEDPGEALVRMREKLYPVVLSDIRMPGMNGVQLLREIKRINPLSNVIMMTGYTSMSHVVECLGSGAVDYFTKPFEDIDLVVRAVLDARERTRRWRQAMPMTAREEG